MNRKARVLLLLALLMAAAATALAQIGTDPNMVYIRASVTDSQGRFAEGLPPEDFKIEEDKTPQQIVSLSEKDIPLSVAIMIDAREPLKETLKSTVPRFFMPGGAKTADQLFLMENGEAPLNAAVLNGLNSLLQRGTNPIRAFVLLTDRPNPGAASFSKVKEVLKDQDVEFFVVGTAGAEGAEFLRDLARMSGGEAFFPPMQVLVPDVGRKIARDLRNQYLIGYRPTNLAQDGKWRKVTVTGRALTFRTRPGYYAPTVHRGAAVQGETRE